MRIVLKCSPRSPAQRRACETWSKRRKKVKWRKRASTVDLADGFEIKRAIVVKFRRRTRLPLDDVRG
jgi:hypothetical protein